MLAGAGGQGRGQRQQAAVGEDDADRPSQDLTRVAHRPASLLARKRSCGEADRLSAMATPAIRDAQPERDAAACAAIYAPYVERTPISFEERPPDALEMEARMNRYLASHPWLVAEDGERWSATPTPVVTWSAPPTAGRPTSPSTSLPTAAARAWAGASTRRSSRGCGGRTSRSPAPASPFPTTPASACTRRSASSASASARGSAGRRGAGTTSAGGNWSWRRPTPATPLEPLPPQ